MQGSSPPPPASSSSVSLAHPCSHKLPAPQTPKPLVLSPNIPSYDPYNAQTLFPCTPQHPSAVTHLDVGTVWRAAPNGMSWTWLRSLWGSNEVLAPQKSLIRVPPATKPPCSSGLVRMGL